MNAIEKIDRIISSIEWTIQYVEKSIQETKSNHDTLRLIYNAQISGMRIALQTINSVRSELLKEFSDPTKQQ